MKLARENAFTLFLLVLTTNGLYGYIWLYRNLGRIEKTSGYIHFLKANRALVIVCYSVYGVCLLLLMILDRYVVNSSDTTIVGNVISAVFSLSLLIGLFLFVFLAFGVVQFAEFLRSKRLDIPDTNKILVSYFIFYYAFPLIQKVINQNVQRAEEARFSRGRRRISG